MDAWTQFGIIEILVVFAALVVCAFVGGILVGRRQRPKFQYSPFAEQPLHPRPVIILEEKLIYERTRASVAEEIAEKLQHRLDVVEPQLRYMTHLRDRHWQSLKRLRKKVNSGVVYTNTRPLRHLYAVA